MNPNPIAAFSVPYPPSITRPMEVEEEEELPLPEERHGRSWYHHELVDWALHYRIRILRNTVFLFLAILFSWNIVNLATRNHFRWCTTTVVVAKDGVGDYFNSISAAIDAAPHNSSHNYKYCILIGKGEYHEYVVLGTEKKYLVFIGDGIQRTIIKPLIQIGGSNVFSGGRLATLVVNGMGFMATDLTIESAAGPQTVAVENWADQSSFYKCRFVGQNDTLYTNYGRQFYRNCHIQGVQYFISGYAKAVFQECRVEAVKLHPEESTFISLSRGSLNMKSGLVFQRCDFLTVGRVGASLANTYLGGRSDNFTSTVVMQSFLDASIGGWLTDNSTCKAYYGEYLNTGPGSGNNKTNSVCIDQIDDSSTASQFTVRAFLKGQDWLPSYVPYDLDLVQTYL